MYLPGGSQGYASARCSLSTCQFQYLWQSTPVAYRYSSLGGSGGNYDHLYRASGIIYGPTADVTANSNYDIKLGGYACVTDPSRQYYNGGDPSIVDGSGIGIIKWCVGEPHIAEVRPKTSSRPPASHPTDAFVRSNVADSQPAGRVNVSLRVDDPNSGYGQALPTRNSWQVCVDLGSMAAFCALLTLELYFVIAGDPRRKRVRFPVHGAPDHLVSLLFDDWHEWRLCVERVRLQLCHYPRRKQGG